MLNVNEIVTSGVVLRKMLELQLIALVNYLAAFIWHLNLDSNRSKRVLMIFYGKTNGNWQRTTDIGQRTRDDC